MSLPITQELVVDLFAGGGGASLGMGRAYRHSDIAVNHNPVAIAVHRANHPAALHYTCDVFEVDPVVATGGRPVGVLWASPDCRHHSKAKGGAPRSKAVRGLAWVVLKWAAACKPRIIHLENVEEFADWGPLTAAGKPCPMRKGRTFRQWVGQLERLGYRVEHRELVAADYGAPTIRKRLYVIARRDGRPIVWPEPSHAKDGSGGLKTWRAAAECIDWSLPSRSIFDRPKPLACNTHQRIAKGIWRYVLTAAAPFIVKPNHTSSSYSAFRGQPVTQPLQTVTRSPGFALVEPNLVAFLTEHANSSSQRVFSANEPLRTQCAQVKGGHFSLVEPAFAPLLPEHSKSSSTDAGVFVLTNTTNHSGCSVLDPVRTVTTGGHHALIAASLVTLRRNADGADITNPLKTISAGGEHHCVTGVTLIQQGHGEREDQTPRVLDLDAPQGTAARRGEQAMRFAHIEQANGGFYDGDGRAAHAPLSTVCASGANQRLVTAYFVRYDSAGDNLQACRQPMHTGPTNHRRGRVSTLQVPSAGLTAEQLAGARRCADFLRTQLCDHFAEPADMVLLQHGDAFYFMVDISLRMLAPRELARAQGFPDSYVIERGADGRAITKTDQVRLIGNSVCPDVAEALVKANCGDLIDLYARCAA